MGVRVFLGIVVVLLGSGCEAARPVERTRGPVSHRDGLAAFSGVELACQSIEGARFRDFKKECECPSLSIKAERGEIFRTGESGGCEVAEPVYSEMPECRGEGAFVEAYLSGNLESLNTCLQTMLRFHGTYFGIEVANGVTAMDALALARELDKKWPHLFAKLWPTNEGFYFNSKVTLHVGRLRADSSFVREFVRSVLDIPIIEQRNRYRVHYLEPDPKQALRSLGHPLDSPKPLRSLPEALRTTYPILERVASTYEKLLGSGLQGNPKTAGDCRRHCHVQEPVGDGIRFKSYFFSVPYRDVVMFPSASGEAVAYLQLGLRGDVSSIIAVETIRTRGVTSRFRVFDRMWNEVGMTSFELTADFDELERLASEVPHLQSEAFSGVVFCEPFALETESLRFLRRNPEDKGSLLGWFSAKQFSWGQRLGEVLSLVDGVLPSAYSPSHAHSVAQVLLGENAASSLIPLSLTGCLERFDEWAPLLRERGVKVVNLSGTDPLDSHACRTLRNPERYLASTHSPFLWVAASGNTGTQDPIDRCPQGLGNLPGLIVVAGTYSNGGGLWQDSDFGESYADIAASIQGPMGEKGTSFSAPRVSAVASDLATKFSGLSVGDLRLAILAGALVPSPPLAVRSGGELSRRGAEVVAEFLSKGKTVREAWETQWGVEEANRRERIWRRNGLWR